MDTARTQSGGVRDGAAVFEVTDHTNLDDWPSGTQLIIKRQPPHPGARRSLFASLAYRFWGRYTDQANDPVDLDVTMRAYAHVENQIARLKDSDLERFPSTNLDANKTWLHVACWSADLARWFQLLCCDDALDEPPRPPGLLMNDQACRSGRFVRHRPRETWDR